MKIRPNPKSKPIRLEGEAYAQFRKSVHVRESGICEGCNRYAPLLVNGVFDEFLCGHVAHIKSRGAGGGDTLKNVRWLCFKCHRGKHAGS